MRKDDGGRRNTVPRWRGMRKGEAADNPDNSVFLDISWFFVEYAKVSTKNEMCHVLNNR